MITLYSLRDILTTTPKMDTVVRDLKGNFPLGVSEVARKYNVNRSSLSRRYSRIAKIDPVRAKTTNCSTISKSGSI